MKKLLTSAALAAAFLSFSGFAQAARLAPGARQTIIAAVEKASGGKLEKPSVRVGPGNEVTVYSLQFAGGPIRPGQNINKRESFATATFANGQVSNIQRIDRIMPLVTTTPSSVGGAK